jgi:hypothetical protein
MPELCARLGIGQDAAGVIIDVGGNESRPNYGEEQQEPGFGAS